MTLHHFIWWDLIDPALLAAAIIAGGGLIMGVILVIWYRCRGTTALIEQHRQKMAGGSGDSELPFRRTSNPNKRRPGLAKTTTIRSHTCTCRRTPVTAVIITPNPAPCCQAAKHPSECLVCSRFVSGGYGHQAGCAHSRIPGETPPRGGHHEQPLRGSS
jgi:hypothetical protein